MKNEPEVKRFKSKKQVQHSNLEEVRPINNITDTPENEWNLTIEKEIPERKDEVYHSEEAERIESILPTTSKQLGYLERDKESPVKLVKLPVLLSSVTTNIDLLHEIQVNEPIECIHKLQWDISSIDGKVFEDSKTLFLTGNMTVNAYVETVDNMSMKGITFTIPWTTTEKVKWIHEPEVRITTSGEYWFTAKSRTEEESAHYIMSQNHVNPIFIDLHSSKIIWFNQKNSSENAVTVQGCCSIKLYILQEQYVSYNNIHGI